MEQACPRQATPRQNRRDRPVCGAKTRKGVPCVRKVVPGKARCRNHGGLSTGPRTAEGKARCTRNWPHMRLLEP